MHHKIQISQENSYYIQSNPNNWIPQNNFRSFKNLGNSKISQNYGNISEDGLSQSYPKPILT